MTITVNKKDHPLEVLEILMTVASYLPRSSLRNCVRVSSVWHKALIRLLWKDCRLTVFKTPDVPAIRVALKKHARLVQKLAINTLYLQGDSLFFPQLKSLDLTYQQHAPSTSTQVHSQSSTDDTITDFLGRHSAKLDALALRAFPAAFKQIMRLQGPKHGLSKLSNLSIHGPSSAITLSELDEDAWVLWKNLTVLELDQVQVQTGATSAAQRSRPPATLFSQLNKGPIHMRELTIRHCGPMSAGEEFKLIEKCGAELRVLKWFHSHDFYKVLKPLQGIKGAKLAATDKYNAATAAGTGGRERYRWAPKLERLDLSLSEIRDEDLAMIIGTVKSTLKQLHLFDVQVDYYTKGVLTYEKPLVPNNFKTNSNSSSCSTNTVQDQQQQQPLCKRLESLTLSRCGVTGKKVNFYLSQCPRLLSFRGDGITDEDVEKRPLPWVCTNLRVLELGLALRTEKQVPDWDDCCDYYAYQPGWTWNPWSGEDPPSSRKKSNEASSFEAEMDYDTWCDIQYDEMGRYAALNNGRLPERAAEPERQQKKPKQHVPPTPPAWLPSTVLLDKIAGLTRLEKLILRRPKVDRNNRLYMNPTRDGDGYYGYQPLVLPPEDDTTSKSNQEDRPRGLAVLSTLRNLRELEVDNTNQYMTLREAWWMVHHWPKLEKVDVKGMSSDWFSHKGLRTFFANHGIDDTSIY
ncbi:hypothetical protein BGZ83_001268 [Gryganskiella cystojenkinii]|nr:hypothetical protein BGZ83_001268 [Gryganskiella cystojenkinii]